MADSSDLPLVSVIMNAHNSSEYLHEAIASVVAQSHRNWEVILWDNASADDSEGIAASFGDDRIRYFGIPDKVSLYESRMNAFRQAQGEFVAFLDCDDIWLPDKLALQLQVFADPDCAFSSTDYITRDERRTIRHRQVTASRFITYGKPISSTFELLTDYRVGMSTLMVRRDLALAAWPLYPPGYSIIEDYDMVARLMAGGFMVPINEALTIYRLHATNFSWRSAVEVEEWSQWLTDLGSLGLSVNEEKVIRDSVGHQILMLGARTNLLAGRRADVTQAIRQMSSTRDRVKYTAALLLPSPVAKWIAG